MMKMIGSTPKFDFVLDFLDDADRGKINTLIEGLDKVEEDMRKNLDALFS